MTALRVFDAVARLGSCSAAARTVHLSQGAVSKQVLMLEEGLGVALFLRSPRGLTLTAAGERYHRHVTAALAELGEGARAVATLGDERRSLRLHVLPILGDRWLMPRVPAFLAAHPELDVQFTTYVTPEEATAADGEFRFGDGLWPDARSDYLLGRDVALVAAPSLIERHGPILKAADVARFTALEHFQTPLTWAEFAGAHRLRDLQPVRTIRYGFYALVIRAAEAGTGVALVPRALVAKELAEGTLVNPAALGFESRRAYHFTMPLDSPPSPELLAFRDWVLAEARTLEPA